MSITDESVDTGDRADWHEWRRGGIGGSDIAAICGLSPWSSALSVYMEKRGEIPPADLSDNGAVEFGVRMEPILPGWFHDECGLYVVGEQTWCVNPELPWMRCTVDGFVAESPDTAIDDVLGVYEAKVTGLAEWEDGIPENYQIQGQWQMATTGLDHLWFAVAHRSAAKFRIYEMHRDDGVIAELTRLGGDFWLRVETGNPPPVDGSEATTAALAAAYPRHEEGVTVDLDPDLLDRYRIAKGRVEAAEIDLGLITNEIKAALGEAEAGLIDGAPFVTWKAQTRAGIDTKALRAAHPAIAEQFATTSDPFRVMRFAQPTKEKKR